MVYIHHSIPVLNLNAAQIHTAQVSEFGHRLLLGVTTLIQTALIKIHSKNC